MSRNKEAVARPQMTRADDSVATTQAPPTNNRAEAETSVTETPPLVTPIPDRTAVNAEIRSLATVHDLGSDWANGLIDRGATENEARTAALQALSQRQAPTKPLTPRLQVLANNDDPQVITARMAEALYATRANPRHELSEAARPYAGMTTLDMARDCLSRSGVSITGMQPHQVITRALHTTSDFPTIFADTANRVLRDAYAAAPAVLRTVARQTTMRDFRARTHVQAADLAKLEKVNESGEYKYSGFVEAKESYAIGTYGTIIGLTRQAIINDDLGAFNDVAGQLGRASTEFEAQFMVDLVVSNAGSGPIMDDGDALFHANHGNLAASASEMTVTSISSARLAMRRQKGINGRVIAATPKYLLVPPELETRAESLVTIVTPTRTDDVNPFGGRLEVLVEPRLTDAERWYLVADPTQVEGLEYAYLQGAEGPQTESRAGFEVDGVEIKVRVDFGAAFLDWRGWYANDGS
ncbi:MAG: prohead protease/major capsid protein fusion protein [Pseudomonadota bacterium]